MHIITVSVAVSLIKIQCLIILKKGLLTELEKNKKINKKKDSQKDNNIFWVGPVLGALVGTRKTNIFLRLA